MLSSRQNNEGKNIKGSVLQDNKIKKTSPSKSPSYCSRCSVWTEEELGSLGRRRSPEHTNRQNRCSAATTLVSRLGSCGGDVPGAAGPSRPSAPATRLSAAGKRLRARGSRSARRQSAAPARPGPSRGPGGGRGPVGGPVRSAAAAAAAAWRHRRGDTLGTRSTRNKLARTQNEPNEVWQLENYYFPRPHLNNHFISQENLISLV